MNLRENYLKTLLFDGPERIPLVPGKGRESTLNRWHAEGLSEKKCDPDDVVEEAYRAAGGKLFLPRASSGFRVDERMKPWFEEKVIERGERSQIVQDWKGNICEISNEFTPEYLRKPIDFVTRKWIKCPVENRKDFEAIKKRYAPSDASRFDENAKEVGEKLKGRDYPVEIHFSGPFWQLREWLGFENLCMMLLDDPVFIMEMVDFWKEYISELIRRTLKYVTVDIVHFSEDMAYKGHSMISPEMCGRFLLPTWKQWGGIVRSAGVPIFAIDSDGFVGELIPLWIGAGINVCDPIEVAAGNDIVAYRKKFGKDMAYRGGVDKRLIAEGGKGIEDEIGRIAGVIKDGGYIPECDHGVPHDISWANFVYYTKLLAKATGWM